MRVSRPVIFSITRGGGGITDPDQRVNDIGLGRVGQGNMVGSGAKSSYFILLAKRALPKKGWGKKKAGNCIAFVLTGICWGNAKGSKQSGQTRYELSRKEGGAGVDSRNRITTQEYKNRQKEEAAAAYN